MSSESDDGFDAQWQRTRAAIDLERWDVAIEEVQKLLRLDPENAFVHGWLGQAYFSTGKLTQADQALDRGIGLDPEEPWLHRLRALVRRGQKRFKEALVSIDESLSLSPDEASAYYVRSLILEEIGKKKEARESAETAVSLEPSSSTYLARQAFLWLNEDPKRAERDLRAALQIDPNDAVALNNLGVALSKQKRTEEAVMAFRAALLADPNLPQARTNVRDTVGSMIRSQPFSWIIAIIVTAKLAAFHPALALIVLPLALVVYFIVRRVQFQGKLKRLSELDPQLFTLYKTLKRHG